MALRRATDFEMAYLPTYLDGVTLEVVPGRGRQELAYFSAQSMCTWATAAGGDAVNVAAGS